MLLGLRHERGRHAALNEGVRRQEGQLVPKGGLLQPRRREQVLEVGQEGNVGRFVLQSFRRVPFQDVLEGAEVGLPVLDRPRVHADARSGSVEPVKHASVEAVGDA